MFENHATVRQYMDWIVTEWEAISGQADEKWHPEDAWVQVEDFAQAFLRGYEMGGRK